MSVGRAPAVIALGVMVLAGCAVTAPGGPDEEPDPAAASSPPSPYIVVLEDSASVRSDDAEGAAPTVAAEQHAQASGVRATSVYGHALQGYAADLTSEQVQQLEADDQVAYVVEDLMLHTQQQGQAVPTGVRRVFGPENPNLGIGGAADVRVDADIAVIDSGVASHSDLNVVSRVDCTGFFGGCSQGGTDDNGHGTHVAGTAAAINNGNDVVGVAPGARIHAVKVCNSLGQCPTSAIVAGIDHVTANAGTIEVANMSLGGPGTSQALTDAIRRSVDAGVVHVVAAGNDGEDARGFSPASHPDVVTVSALADSDGEPGGTGGAPSCRTQSQDDHRADFSNWGPAVEIAAPGTCIQSTWLNGGLNTISGTSMATPHVTGAAAVLTSGANDPTDRAGVMAVRETLIGAGNRNWTWQSAGSGDVQEPLLDIHDGTVFPPDGSGGGGDGPVATITSSCDEATLACSFDGSTSQGSIVEWAWDFGDGATGSGEAASHTYAEAGSYEVTLTVTDDAGATDTGTATVQVGGPPANQPPVASFTASCQLYFGFWPGCQYDGSGSRDPDGQLASYRWDFGDNTTGTGAQPPLKFYGFFGFGAAGSYRVTLTVTDDQGATSSTFQDVPVR